MSIPNIITLGRAFLVPVIFWLVITGNIAAAFFVFVLAGASDAVDGYLAKRFHWETELGAYLDPLADKMLIVSSFIALGARGDLPVWLVVAVVSRDILIVAAVLISWLVGHPVRIAPHLVSKANTAAQIVTAAIVLADEGFTLGFAEVRLILVWITAVLTVGSLAVYLRAWLRHMTGYESGGRDGDGRS